MLIKAYYNKTDDYNTIHQCTITKLQWIYIIFREIENFTKGVVLSIVLKLIE